jgi:putative SOS response-associated peptidase YedK
MCGRYFTNSDKQRIAEYFQLGQVPDIALAPDYNVAPTTFQPVIRLNRDSGERELELMRWGLIPHFTKSLAEFKSFTTINARAESLASSAVWRVPFERRRCIIPANGFYEWKKLGDAPKAAREPYAITLRNGEPMALAGLWDAWKDPAAGWLQSFSIITTEANEAMAPIHTRMPVILERRDWAEWLDRGMPTQGTRPAPTHLLRAHNSDAMQVTRCSPLVGNIKNNSSLLLKNDTF